MASASQPSGALACTVIQETSLACATASQGTLGLPATCAVLASSGLKGHVCFWLGLSHLVWTAYEMVTKKAWTVVAQTVGCVQERLGLVALQSLTP